MMKSLLFFLKLHRTHATQCLLAFDAFFLALLKNLLVLNTEFATLDIKTVERDYDRIGVRCLSEISKGKSAESALSIKMVVKRIRRRDGERSLTPIISAHTHKSATR